MNIIINNLLENRNTIIIIISILLIIISIIVLTRINPMISLFNLIIFYILIGMFLYKLNLNILGILYILIYVGAISVLFIFILSLINIKNSELYYKTYSPDLLIVIYSFILFMLLITSFELNNNNENIILSINSLLEFNNVSNLIEFKLIGELLYTEYSIIFIILGIILLLSIVSAILLIGSPKNRTIN